MCRSLNSSAYRLFLQIARQVKSYFLYRTKGSTERFKEGGGINTSSSLGIKTLDRPWTQGNPTRESQNSTWNPKHLKSDTTNNKKNQCRPDPTNGQLRLKSGCWTRCRTEVWLLYTALSLGRQKVWKIGSICINHTRTYTLAVLKINLKPM